MSESDSSPTALCTGEAKSGNMGRCTTSSSATPIWSTARAAPAGPVLVAHSLSCLLVPWWVRRGTGTVRGALLVAPVDPLASAFPAEAADFTDFPVRRLPFPTTVVGSDDDPYATADWSRRFAGLLGADYRNLGAHGHVNADSGLGDWPEGAALLRELVDA